MKKNKLPFDITLQQISNLLTHAQNAENPAMYLFTHDLRTPLFYLEGLSRIYAATGPRKKKFKKLQEKFKLLEDMLGRIDYFEELNKSISQHSHLPEYLKFHFLIPAKNAISDLNEVLLHFGWLDGEQLKKIQRTLEKVEWKDPQEEHKRLELFYYAEIEKITAFAKNGTISFSDMELGIHEFRRKLRWLSIYAHALHGGIQLVDIEKERLTLENYLTDTVLNSRFNKLPPADKQTIPLRLSKYNFYALSWMIGRLGELKDQGLTLISLAETISQTYLIQNEEEALLKAQEVLGENSASLDELLQEGNKITKQFFKDGVLKNLIK